MGGCSPSKDDSPIKDAGAAPAGGKCPFLAMQGKVDRNPQKLDLKVLNPVNHGLTREEYALLFATLDLAGVKKDIAAALKDSQSWWPADWGHYGPFMLRLAWHQAGTYRTADGRGGANGGNMRFNPLDSWPDNGNLDKARRILWPIKRKYGDRLSWADLVMLVGNVAMEDMGFKTFGFMGGRVDTWAREEEVYWGKPESFQGLAKDASKLEMPLAASVMSLIYVNPEGPDGNPDPLLAAGHIRETFGRMAMNDEETVALIAGGHTFGKCHGAAPGDKHQGPNPSEANIEEQGFGWTSTYKTGKGADAITSGLEGAWTAKPTQWDHGYMTNLFQYEWELHKGPGGAWQWRPKNYQEALTVPEAHEAGKMTYPMMLTTDLSLRMDPAYLAISKRFYENPKEFALAYAKAWFKLTHRDMGPRRRGLGPEVPEEQIWQDPIPQGKELDASRVEALKAAALDKLLGTLSLTDLIRTAWASACTFRHTDFRGGANGARLCLSPQKDWAINRPAELSKVLAKYEEVRNKLGGVSMADFIVLAGSAAVEEAARRGGAKALKVAVATGRGDATQKQTDVESFQVLEPASDGFRNSGTPSQLVDRAHLLGLSAKEMALLVAGFRAMDLAGERLGALTDSPGERLDNSFFLNLLDMKYQWRASGDGLYEGVEREGGKVAWSATAVDLAFGSHPELRAIAEKYACDDAKHKFAADFAAAWTKVMNNDRYDGRF